MRIALKRVYEPPVKTDGFRVLVDRLWPRGLAKAKAQINFWDKDVAPSNELRQWFNHEAEKWAEFRKRYRVELNGNPEVVDALKQSMRGHDTVTLLFSAKDAEHNQAVVLREYLEK